MKELLDFVVAHPGLSIVFFMGNSVAMMAGGIWAGLKMKDQVSKSELETRLQKENEAHARIHDEMAHSYQRTMEETAIKVREIFDTHTEKVAGYLKGVTETSDEMRKTLKNITRDTFQLKGAMSVLLPKGAAADIFTKTQEDL